MEDPNKTRRPRDTGMPGPQGGGVPAKGDSSPDDSPSNPAEGATLIDPPLVPPESTSAGPGEPDVTLTDAIPGKRKENRASVRGKGVLNPGDVVGKRYEILQILGQGGMGAVYKALDREVERTVALKLIRPELAADSSILARFKQELLTARQVTHRNVIRIHDLFEADVVKFITMEYVEGCDLRKLLDKGKLPPEQAVEIIRQVCLALDAAHSVEVIHRDLKPQNIMQDKQGRVLVMDFGLARSLQSDGMTQTGALLGTIEYMSPEQAMGADVDCRSDLFAVGLIFYELLTHKMPYKADTAMASLLKRNQERAIPASQLDTSIPKGLSDIVSKCLERDLNLRYQSAQEILADLDAWQGKRPILASVVTPAASTSRTINWRWIAAGALAAALGIGVWVLVGKVIPKTPSHEAAVVPEVSLAILPFRNGSADAGLDWLGRSLADMLNTDVGQSAHVRTISPERLSQVLSDLQVRPGTAIDPTMVKRIAEFSNADTVVWGEYAKFGDQIRIDATLLDLKHNRRAPLKIEAVSEKEIPKTVDGLADLIRKNLAVSTDVMKELKASSYQPTSKSLPALRDFNQGVQLLRDGKNLEAVKSFQAAVKEDPEFALAYAKLGQTYANLGHDNEADQYSRKAVELSENLPAREKYFIAANNFRIERNYPKAVESYLTLATAAPDDADTQFALADLYERTGAFDKSRDHFSKILAADPKRVDALLAIGRVEIKSGNPQGGLEHLTRGLTLAIQLGNEEEKGALLQAVGAAYGELNKQEEALRYYQQALEVKRGLGDKRGIAVSLEAIAQLQDERGKAQEAWKDYEDALKLLREVGDKVATGDILMDLGTFKHDRAQYDDALVYFKESLQIKRDLGNESDQGMCLNNIGSCYFFKGDYENALTSFQQALQLREKSKVPADLVLTVHNLAETNAKAGQFDKAMSFYARALDLYRSTGNQRGAAMETYGMGTLFGYQGRFGSAIAAKQEALKTFQDLKDNTYWMAEILSGYGMALADAGRIDEAQKILDRSLTLARELKNDGSIAQALNY